MAEKNCKLCFHYAVCYAVGRMLERAETCSKYAPDVVEVKHSRWENISGFDVCNICGTSPAYCEPKPNNPKGYPPYCHHCGAKMDLSEKPTGCGRRDT